MSKRWYDDWELTLIGWDDGLARIDIILPHHDPDTLSIHTTKDLAPPLANLLDKLLSELTGTKGKSLTDGSSEPAEH